MPSTVKIDFCYKIFYGSICGLLKGGIHPLPPPGPYVSKKSVILRRINFWSQRLKSIDIFDIFQFFIDFAYILVHTVFFHEIF